MKKLLCSVPLLMAFLSSQAQTDWQPLPYVFNSHIEALYVYDNTLFIGGNFLKINNNNAIHSAQYNGSSMIGNTTPDEGGGGFVSFTEYNNKLIGGGDATVGDPFYGAAMVLEWDGSEWGNSIYHLYGNVWQVIGYHDTLFTTSSFTSEDIGFDYTGYFDGVSWKQAGDSLSDSPQYVIFNDELYAYGLFTTSGNRPVKYFAKWQNKNWVQAGSGTRIPAFPVVFRNKLYAFEAVSQDVWQTTLQLIEWNGSDWIAHPDQTIVSDANHLRAITADDNNIYIAGDLLKAGNKNIFNAARFDGTSWYGMGDALDTVLVNTLQVYNGDLYAGTSEDYTSYKAYMYKFSLSQITAVNDPQQQDDRSFYYDCINRQLVFSETHGAYNIISGNGALIMEGNTKGAETIALGNLDKGVYLVRYYTSSGVESRKIVIN